MKNTHQLHQSAIDLFAKAKAALAEDMQNRNIGAIIWDNSTAGFHYIPEIVHRSTSKDKVRVARITGLYLFQDIVYLIEEGRSGVGVDEFYNPDNDIKPTVVTLTPQRAEEDFGNPDSVKGFTTQGSLEEWLAIADCYYEALNED